MKLPPASAHLVTQERARRGWGLRYAADRAGVSVGSWRRAEAGETVHYSTLIAVAEALGWTAVDADRLIDGEPPQAADTATPDEVGLAALAGELSPEDRAKVEGYIRGLLDGKNG